jgi:hypothetical protein
MPANGQSAFNVRSRVHEYGGGAYLVLCFRNNVPMDQAASSIL